MFSYWGENTDTTIRLPCAVLHQMIALAATRPSRRCRVMPGSLWFQISSEGLLALLSGESFNHASFELTKTTMSPSATPAL